MRRLPLLVALSSFLVASSALAAPIAGWTFEDQDLIVDTTSANNTDNAIAATGSAPTWSTSGNPGGTAASFSSMATQEVSSFSIPFDATGFSDVRVAFALRPSNTANKWWRVEVSVGGGAFSAVGSLVELTGEAWSNHTVLVPAADGAANVVVRVIATDSNGDGTGTFVQADGVGAPSAQGTLRIDDVLVDEDVAVVPDAGPDPTDAGPLPPPPAITEVAWMGSLSDANDEWVELYNPGPADISDLSAFVLVDNGGASALPAVPLLAGEIVVIERSAAATSLAPPDAEVLPLALTNGGTTEHLRVCPASDPSDVAGCDVARVPGLGWPAGSNTSKRTMVRADAALDGSLSSSWVTYDGAASAVTDSGGVGILGSPGTYEPLDVLPPPTDGGVIVDGGVISVPDAGPNEAPSLVVSQPSGQVSAGGDVTISYTATDPDGDDTVSVALYYDLDDDGNDGVRIARGLPAGERSFSWSTLTVPPGTYRIFGVATDQRGEVSYAYAPGSVVVEGGVGSDEGSIELLDPDGVNDVVNGRITVRWEVTLPAGEEGVVSLFYDDDDAGLDGEPIIAGLPVTGIDGEPGPRTYLWDPVSVPPGAYTVYAVVDWTGGSRSDYSEFVTVGGGGCGCRSTEGDAITALFALVILLVPRVRRRRHRGVPC